METYNVCLKKCIHVKKNNLKISYTEKKIKHTHSVYSLFTSYSFDPTKNRLDCYRDKDCMERFCKNLKEHATRIINYEKKQNYTTDR